MNDHNDYQPASLGVFAVVISGAPPGCCILSGRESATFISQKRYRKRNFPSIRKTEEGDYVVMGDDVVVKVAENGERFKVEVPGREIVLTPSEYGVLTQS